LKLPSSQKCRSFPLDSSLQSSLNLLYARAPLQSITFHSHLSLPLLPRITAMPRSQTLALSPSTQQSPVRHSPQRTMPTRTRQQLNNVPGIINLPMSTKLVHDSYPSSNSSQSPSRHNSTIQSLGSKPLASLDQALLGHQQDETKKRRRQKKTTPATVQLEQAGEGGLSQNPVSPLPSHSVQLDENGVEQSTPTKSRNRRGRRGNRQTSPPLPEINSQESGFSSTTPPLADSHAHSQSVPPELPPHHHHNHYSHQSSEDEWDMPSRGGKRTSGGAVKESLSWQQELLKTTSTSVAPRNTHSHNHRNENKLFESPNSRPSPRQTRNSVPTPHRHVTKARPVLHPSLSDTNASSSSTNPSLNWQQEMLLQTDLQTSALSENRRTHSSSPTKPTPVTVSHTAPSSTMTPARQRQQRIKDSITFGLNDLDLSDEPHSAEDIFNSPISRHNSMNRRHQNQGTRRQSPPTNVEFATPTKLESLEPRYAGPTFHNSPAPSSLPVPSFVLRRQT